MCRDSGFSHDEATSLVVAAATPEVKEALKIASSEAAKEGAFGVPYMCLDGPGIPARHRHWFGADVLPTVALVLGVPFTPQPVSKL
jgi:2-hydroxychromene-2-carboxylate isomerase